MMWGLEHTWSEIAYLKQDFVSYLASTINRPEYYSALLPEIFNGCLNAGISIDLKSMNSEVIDIDKISDLDIANGKFNIH